MMVACRLATEWKMLPFRRGRVSAEKKVSTALSQKADVGVKWNIHLAWHASQARTLGRLWVA